jgi:hypothetical protein
MIVTLKSVQKGLYKLQILKEKGEIEYKDIEPNKLYDFLQACEFYDDVNGNKFTFLMDANVKKFVSKWLENLVKQYNKNIE